MKKHYTLVSIFLLVALLTALFAHQGFSQQKATTPVKKVKVKKQIKNSDDSVKVMVKTIELKDVNGEDINVDSLIEVFKKDIENDKHHAARVVQIVNGDTIIDEVYGDNAHKVWVQKSGSNTVVMKQHATHAHGNNFVFFNSDSNEVVEFDMDFSFDIDEDSVKWIDEDGNKVFIMKKGHGNADDEVEVIVHKMDKGHDNKMIFINDDGENIRIERDGEMVFFSKSDDVKNVNSNIEVVTNKRGERMVLLQTRILLDDLSAKETGELKNAGFKISSRQPDFEYIKFHPNPSKSSINISFKLDEAADTEVIISDMLGKTIFEEQLKSFSGEYNQAVDVKQFGPGSYILQIKHGKKAITRKVLVE